MRNRRSHEHGPGTYSYSNSYGGDSHGAQDWHENQQRDEQREYEKRVRELGTLPPFSIYPRLTLNMKIFAEEEIKCEEAEKARQSRAKKEDERARQQARTRAFEAMRKGDASRLREILAETSGLELSKPGAKGETLLHAASRSGSLEGVKLLVDNGAPLPSLSCVCLRLTMKTVGADVAITDTVGAAPFHTACAAGHADIIAYFLEHHSRAVHSSRALPDGSTPLRLAVASGRADAVLPLVKSAPVHDVAHCWGVVEAREKEDAGEKPKWEAIKEVLRNKVCPTLCSCRHAEKANNEYIARIRTAR